MFNLNSIAMKKTNVLMLAVAFALMISGVSCEMWEDDEFNLPDQPQQSDITLILEDEDLPAIDKNQAEFDHEPEYPTYQADCPPGMDTLVECELTNEELD